ncbi:hypothetical protein K438DRAFT_1979154 [Mycena galopus ATCC 62051]|nr:hypothetical protein K438DRAFT_1979154 [Mycena galopus ATCC 62051]
MSYHVNKPSSAHTTTTGQFPGRVGAPMDPDALARPRSDHESDLSLLQLPRELILSILDCLPEPELLRFCEVSSGSQQLALLTLLARYGVSESQIHSQELSKISSRAIHSLCASYPTILPNIRRLDFDFTNGDVDHLHPWRSLIHLAECFPIIPRISFAFSDRSSASERFSGLWNMLPTTLIALMGKSHARPVVIIHYLGVTALHPKVPNLLKRALKTPTRPSALAVPVVDKMKLTRKLFSTIATASTRRLLSTISLRSFNTDPPAPLGVLMVLNSSAISYLDIDDRVLSRAEWEFLMGELHLPSLRALIIRVDFEFNHQNHSHLSAFIEKHDKIEFLDFPRDWSCLHDDTRNSTLKPFSTSTLLYLKHITASARVVAGILQIANEFPLLEYVGIGSREPILPADKDKAKNRPKTDGDSNGAACVQDALRALAARPSVMTLVLHLQSIALPWADFHSAEEKNTRAETLNSIQKLELVRWTREAGHTAFPAWLALFPALQDVLISADMDTQPLTARGQRQPLVSKRLQDAITERCPWIAVRQELRMKMEHLKLDNLEELHLGMRQFDEDEDDASLPSFATLPPSEH